MWHPPDKGLLVGLRRQPLLFSGLLIFKAWSKLVGMLALIHLVFVGTSFYRFQNKSAETHNLLIHHTKNPS